MSTIIRNQNGFALMAMTFAAAMVVAIMIFMANEVYRGSAASRSHAKEQIAAINLMKEIAVTIRRGYDLRVSRAGLGCPAPAPPDPGYVTVTLNTAAGNTQFCIPAGDDSCFGHPMDPTPNPADSTRPRVCLRGAASSIRKLINLSFVPDPTQKPEVWDEFYKEKGWDTYYVRSFIKSLNRGLDPLPRAEAQNLANSPWFPTAATINAGAAYRTTDPAPSINAYDCSAAGTLCVSFSVCLRIDGCDNSENVQDRFTQTIALDRANSNP